MNNNIFLSLIVRDSRTYPNIAVFAGIEVTVMVVNDTIGNAQKLLPRDEAAKQLVYRAVVLGGILGDAKSVVVKEAFDRVREHDDDDHNHAVVEIDEKAFGAATDSV